MTVKKVSKWNMDQHERGSRGQQTMPAAPPPTMTTFVLSSLTSPSEDILLALRVY